MIDYREVRTQLKTGDLVFFSGTGIISGVIKLFTGSPWSHVGMVVKIAEVDAVLVWESTSISKTKDVIRNSLVSGVQITALSERAKEYDYRVGVNQLTNPLNPWQLNLLADLRHEFNGRPYEQSRLDLAFSAIDFADIHQSEDLSSLFCSEMVAEALKRLGILRTDKPSDEFTPADLARMEL